MLRSILTHRLPMTCIAISTFIMVEMSCSNNSVPSSSHDLIVSQPQTTTSTQENKTTLHLITEIKKNVEENKKLFITLAPRIQRQHDKADVFRFTLTPFRRGSHLVALASIGLTKPAEFIELSICTNGSCRQQRTIFANNLLTQIKHPSSTIKARACQVDQCSQWKTGIIKQNINLDLTLEKFHQKKRAIHEKFIKAAVAFRSKLSAALSANKNQQIPACQQLAVDSQTLLNILSDHMMAAAFSFAAEKSDNNKSITHSGQAHWLNENQKFFSQTVIRRPVTITTESPVQTKKNQSYFSHGLSKITQKLEVSYIDSTAYISADEMWQITQAWIKSQRQSNQDCSQLTAHTALLSQDISSVLQQSRQRLAQINHAIYRMENN